MQTELKPDQTAPSTTPITTLRTPSKMGRPKKHYTDPRNGKVYEGLNRSPSGRWRIIDTNRTLVEDNIDLAIAWFRTWQREQEDRHQPRHYAELEDGIDHIKSIQESGGTPHIIPVNDPVRGPVLVSEMGLSNLQWAWLREQLLKRPQWVAEQVGIEQVGWLSDLPRPQKSPTLDEVRDWYMGREDISSHEKSRCKGVWESFRKFMEGRGITTIKQVDPESVALWGNHYTNSGLSAGNVGRDMKRVKTVARRYLKTGKAQDDTRKLVDSLAVLIIPKTVERDSEPISVEDFQTLLKGAEELGKTDPVEGARWTASLLLALNAAFYAQDLLDCCWGDLDLTKGTLHNRRVKTGIPRVASLWSRTVEALKDWRKLSKVEDDPDRDWVFPSATGKKPDISKWHRAFGRLREGLPEGASMSAGFTGFREIRDGAYTAGAMAGGSLDPVKLLAGHSVGISDKYLKPNAEMVKPVCQAIEKHYFGG